MGYVFSPLFDWLYNQKEEKPTPRTFWESVLLFFKREQCDYEPIIKEKHFSVTNYTDYKMLKGKKFIIRTGGMTSFSLPTIRIG